MIRIRITITRPTMDKAQVIPAFGSRKVENVAWKK
jgi:hypothetical protein